MQPISRRASRDCWRRGRWCFPSIADGGDRTATQSWRLCSRSCPKSPAPARGFVFDAHGTLFDVHSIVAVGREVTADPQALSATWRQKQLDYTWLRALMGRYEDFWTVTEAALRYAIRRLALTASEAQIH